MWNAEHAVSYTMALPKALRLLLMCFASSKRSPVASLLPTLSLPVHGIAADLPAGPCCVQGWVHARGVVFRVGCMQGEDLELTLAYRMCQG